MKFLFGLLGAFLLAGLLKVGIRFFFKHFHAYDIKRMEARDRKNASKKHEGPRPMKDADWE